MSAKVSDVVSVSEGSQKLNSNETEKKSTKHQPPFPGFGIICSILSTIMFSLNVLLVKLIHSNTALQQSASRNFVQFLILLPIVTYNWKYKDVDYCGPPGMFRFLLLRGLLGSSAAICLYQSVERISLGDAVTLSYSNVIFAGFLSYLLLKESFTIFDLVMSVLAMIGIILISKPSFLFGGFRHSHEHIVGVLFGLASGVLAGLTFIAVRKLGKATRASLNVMYYSLIGSSTTLIMLEATDSFVLPCLSEVPYISLLGVTGVAAQLFMTLTLHYERANTFAVLRSFQIVFVFILQVVVLHDTPSTLSLVGSGLIFMSVIGLALRKVYNSMLKRCNQKEQ